MLCVRPSLPLLFESSIFIMDGSVSGECLDYGGKSKWLGKPLASLVSSAEHGRSAAGDRDRKQRETRATPS